MFKKSILPYITLILCCFVFQSSINAQSKVEKIDQLLQKYTEYKQFNGSVLIAANGKVLHKGGYGMANMEWDIPNKANTKHRLGSISKQFTTMLIMQLVEQGKLKLDVPITTYLPDYPKENGDRITLHHLMTHSAGIPNYTSFPNFFQEVSRDPFTPVEFTEQFSKMDLEFTPGEKSSYSNSGYFLLGVIIEKVTGKSYEQVLQENIFTPLKMNDSGYDHHETIMANRAAGYEKRGGSFINAPYLDMSIPYAAGSLYASAEDLYKWDQALYNHTILSKKSTDLLFTKHIPFGSGHYGYGWSIDDVPLNETIGKISIIGHGGGINGFNTLITRMPKEKHLVVLLNNTGGTVLEDITRNIVRILYEQEYDLPKKSVANSLYDKIQKKGIQAGLSHFEAIKADKSYSLNEGEMNNVGYAFLQDKKVEEAIAVFQLNVDNFPKSSNVYDSLGEALMEKGDKEKSIANYKKSIELNPANQNGIDMLKKMGADVSEYEKEMTVSTEILDTYLGNYELAPGFILTVTREGSQLITQATGQPSFPIFPKSETEFYVKAFPAQITFNREDDGKVMSVTLLQGGQEVVGKRKE